MRISVRPRLEFSIMRNTIAVAALFAALLAAVLPYGAGRAGAAVQPAAQPASKPSASPGAAQIYFIWPHDGTVISGGKVWVRMGLRNMGVAPKGTAVPNTGHHHLLIDTELPSMTEPIPNDRNHLHFGAGETEARVELPPGTHTLQLLLGDMNHVPHKPPVLSKKITVTVR
jgi:hypothetical protein